MTVDSPSRYETAPRAMESPGAISLVGIDQSCRTPVLFFLTSALAWLGIGTFLGLINSVQLFWPGFLEGISWTTFGRIRPATSTALLYGFAVQAGLAASLWLMCRLGRRTLLAGPYILLGGVFWNLGVTIGVVGIFAGHNTGFEWLEMPGYAAPILFLSYLVIGVGTLLNFAFRPQKELYISQWYLLAALVWFPWLFSTAQLLLLQMPVRGALQGVVNLWYINNFTELWMSAIGLGILFYFIPKILSRPIHSYQLAILGFWSLALFGSWAGLHAGLPVPKWIPTISIVGTVFMILPLLAVAINFYHTIGPRFVEAKHNLAFRFILFAALAYVLATLLKIGGAFRSVSELTQFTLFTEAVALLHLYGFYTMAIAGAFYFIAPRLAQCETVPARYMHLHFWLAAGGMAVLFAAYGLGGILQGVAVNLSSNVPLGDAVRITWPFLAVGTLGLAMLLGAQLIFLGNALWFLGACARACCPGLFRFGQEEPVGGEA